MTITEKKRPTQRSQDMGHVLLGKMMACHLLGCTGRLGLCAFYEVCFELWQLSVFNPFSPQPPVTPAVGATDRKRSLPISSKFLLIAAIVDYHPSAHLWQMRGYHARKEN